MSTEKINHSVSEEQVGVDEQISGTDNMVNDPTEKTGLPEETGENDVDTSDKPIDFSDEDAALAAASDSDMDFGEEEDGDEDSNSEDATELMSLIPKMSKPELVDKFASLLESKPVQQLRREAEAIKVAFFKIHKSELESRMKQFVDAGGTPEEFTPAVDMNEARLKELFSEYKRKKAEYLANLEQFKEKNLAIKFAIIEELKDLVKGNETMNNTFNQFRDLQQRWKDTGVVPQANVKELWETYNLHVENFYNYIKINKELRDLDLKRNYETKIQLCEAAEALVLETSVITAFHKLQDLHDQWRETGPVANEFKDALWERFKEASSRINKQHQEHFEKQKDEQRVNLELKTELCVKAEELTNEILTTPKDWNKASEQLIEIQKVWKTIGFAPQKDNTKIYERFRKACDTFFEAKRNFYEQTKSEMENNLQLKNEICEIAESIQDSEQWKKTTDELIALQKKWREIGPVPRRHSDIVWKRFRAACDKFFERKAAHFSQIDNQQDENLAKKIALLAEMESADISTGGIEAIKEFQRQWNEIGYVPIKEKETIQRRYKAAVDAMFNTLRSGSRERNIEHYRNRLSNLKNDGDRKLRFERDKLYNKVKQLEADIVLLENNIGFFSKSKNAESMIRDVQNKIDKAKREKEDLIEKINLIDAQDNENA